MGLYGKFQPFANSFIPFMRLEWQKTGVVKECELAEIDFSVYIVQIHPNVSESLRQLSGNVYHLVKVLGLRQLLLAGGIGLTEGEMIEVQVEEIKFRSLSSF